MVTFLKDKYTQTSVLFSKIMSTLKAQEMQICHHMIC